MLSSWTISELSDGRLILGLGISHRRMVESLGIEMNEPRAYLRSYVQAVKEGLAGESTEGLFRPRRAAHAVPARRHHRGFASGDADARQLRVPAVLVEIRARDHEDDRLAVGRDLRIRDADDARQIIELEAARLGGSGCSDEGDGGGDRNQNPAHGGLLR